jgi:hypothetical protein
VPNPVIVADLEARFRPLTDVETSNAQALLDDTWEELLARVPSLDQRVTDGRTSVGLVIRVVSAMALRVLRNPEAIKQWSVDDAAFTRDSLVSSGLLYANSDEIDLLSGRASAARRGAFSITPQQDPVCAPGSESGLIDYLRYGRRW